MSMLLNLWVDLDVPRDASPPIDNTASDLIRSPLEEVSRSSDFHFLCSRRSFTIKASFSQSTYIFCRLKSDFPIAPLSSKSKLHNSLAMASHIYIYTNCRTRSNGEMIQSTISRTLLPRLRSPAVQIELYWVGEVPGRSI